MARHLISTLLVEVLEGTRERLMNEIKATSRFNSVPLTKKESELQHTAEVQLKIARDLKDGWVRNGPDKFAKYRIYQVFSDGSREEVA